MLGNSEELDTIDIRICGGGPTGALLSVLLGQSRFVKVVSEREPEIATDPHGIALHEDCIRMLQVIGVYDKIFTEIGLGRLEFCSKRALLRPSRLKRFKFRWRTFIMIRAKKHSWPLTTVPQRVARDTSDSLPQAASHGEGYAQCYCSKCLP